MMMNEWRDINSWTNKSVDRGVPHMHAHKYTHMQTARLPGSLCALLMLVPRSYLSVLLKTILGKTAFSCQRLQLIISLTVMFNISHANLECRQTFHQPSLASVSMLPTSPLWLLFGIFSLLRGSHLWFAFLQCLLYVFVQYLFVIFIVFPSLSAFICTWGLNLSICFQKRRQDALWS